MAAKVLQLRSADGKVLVAPAWDYRPAAAQARPLEMRVPSRALERVLQYWTKHSLAKATGRPRRHAGTGASGVAAPATAARADPVRAWCGLVHHLKGVDHGEPSPAPTAPIAFHASHIAVAARPGPATTLPAAAGAEPVGVRCAVRARGRQMAEDEESACHHRKRPTSKAPLCLSANAVAPVKKVSGPVAFKACSFVGSTPLPVTAVAPGVKKMTPASTLRARRGMRELSCKVPKQNKSPLPVTAVAAPRKQPIPCLSPVVLRPC
ncbi:unnamed protein product [Triticum turgidum subsp. durum]|uniref:Uncharacterized protein n=1 Tax=Triticum turgidum subsp. durum TaxID=4567 RepID=A0A9R1PGN1_TRITD|nr:unnamed protein product [Triticum turgidum subsp. durum]